MRTVAWVNGIGRLTGADLYALLHAADRIGTGVSNLAACEGFETGGTFNPAEPNRAGSGARGVIQFMPKTMCALLGMPFTEDTAKIASVRFCAMSFIEQQEFVVKYFAWYKGKNLSTLEALYCAVFWPAAIEKPDSYVIARRPPPELPKAQWTFEHKAYVQNEGFDRFGNKDGVVTRAEVVAAIRKYRATGDDKPEIEIQDPDALPLTEEDKRAIQALVLRTSEEETEDWRRGSPLPSEEDDPEPPTEPNA